MEQGGVERVQNGARRGSDGVKWCKEGWKMGQGGVETVQSGARRGGDGAEWGKEGRRWSKMVQGWAAMV